ncbi:MAG: HD domain-containing protein [Anaerolineae bacterium]
MIDVETARTYYAENDSAHGFDHVLRVWRLAERIGLEEGADMQVLQAAALLHDVGRPEELRTGACHARLSAEAARRILSGRPDAQVEAVALAIAEHRFRANRPPSTLEARVLFDADKLDAIGAIGVARAYAIAGARNQRLWAEVPAAYAERSRDDAQADLGNGEHTPIHEYLFKLVRLKDHLYTATAKRMAEERHAFMVAFFTRLEGEVRGEL